MLEDYLKEMSQISRMKDPSYFYKSTEEFVLKNGQLFVSKELTEEEKKIVLDLIKDLHLDCKVKECFKNSQQLAVESDGKIQYVEGFADDIIPVVHGWNAINGKVIDLTWCDDGDLVNKSKKKWEKRKLKIVLGEFKNIEYFGVVFPVDMIRKNMLKTKQYQSLIDDWENQYPLLKQSFKINCSEKNGRLQ